MLAITLERAPAASFVQAVVPPLPFSSASFKRVLFAGRWFVAVTSPASDQPIHLPLLGP